MQKQLKQVEEFMTLFGQEVKREIDTPSGDVMDLRVRLLREEVEELQEACDKQDMVGILDALTDIRYVLEGAVLSFGLQGIAEEAFDAVHDSNMTKACNSLEFANETMESYAKLGVATYIEQGSVKSKLTGGPLFLVKRKADGKVLKSIHWREQDLVSILANAKEKEKQLTIDYEK